eukprot:scaffold7233_cov108-Cylindrotheca_fusiformis.AAC.1
MSNTKHDTDAAIHTILTSAQALEAQISDLDWSWDSSGKDTVTSEQQQEIAEQFDRIKAAKQKLQDAEREVTRLRSKIEDAEKRRREAYEATKPRVGECYWTARTNFGEPLVAKIQGIVADRDAAEVVYWHQGRQKFIPKTKVNRKGEISGEPYILPLKCLREFVPSVEGVPIGPLSRKPERQYPRKRRRGVPPAARRSTTVDDERKPTAAARKLSGGSPLDIDI